MTRTYTWVLLFILLITGGYLVKAFFEEDDALKRVEFELQQTKLSLNEALNSNKQTKKEITQLNLQLTNYQAELERFQHKIDIINLLQERIKVATFKRRQTIDSLLKIKRERLSVLIANDSVFD
ncbi:hypothetical protein [Pseudotamlana carrageenivorans]|uniref:Uncharacterized protein n=1 Tax=Pseudotamlana carrageenivorans TaxID=2069432 RepID=A0A2I7SLL6_9FLAO|nr:hypothetical protein [Tamlana carrageenivorans]AUS06734.1 hypothetical protein C1A40_15350 [Tamlana carrageenivorans]